MKRSVKAVFSFLFSIAFCLVYTVSYSQTKTDNTIDDKALKILDKAIGDVFTSQDIGIYFEGITFGIKIPEDIFTLPVYKVFKGGYLFVKDNKYEMELSLMKTICDGNVMVVVNEQTKTMLIDSVRTGKEELKQEELQAFLDDDFKDANLVYNGMVTINTVKCHKITSIVTNKDTSTSVDIIYWVNVSTGNLYLMAEKQDGLYNVYWINKVGKSPPNQNYKVNLPAKRLTTYHGYSVVDNRFTNEE